MSWINTRRWILATAIIALNAGCTSMEPLSTVEEVDLDQFMGKWYVIASIPTFVEKSAYNATETYERNSDGTIATTFAFRKGSFEGKQKVHTPKGFVSDQSNAIWGMQFIWPIKADYRIVYLDEDYSKTIIGRNKRDYVWIMSRSPNMDQREYDDMVAQVSRMGYETSKLRRVPHNWE